MEADQVDVLSSAMLGNLQKVNDSLEPRLTRKLRSDVAESDRKESINLDFALFHSVAIANHNVGALPDADAASDLTPPHSVAQPLREDHWKTLLPQPSFVWSRIRTSLPNT
jgi:hypothetical protein